MAMSNILPRRQILKGAIALPAAALAPALALPAAPPPVDMDDFARRLSALNADQFAEFIRLMRADGLL